MLAKSPIVLLTAALALFSKTLAAPAQNATEAALRLDKEYDFHEYGSDSPFIACLKSKNAYENDGIMDHDAALECRHAFSDNHQARSLPSTFETPQKSSCGKSIPNNFMEAGPFRHAVGGICNDLADKLIQKGLEKGGNAIQHKFKGTAYHKKASWLNDNKNVIFEVAMNLTPQTRAAFKSANVAQGTLNSLCHDGLTKLGTKGEGCTQELGYYKDHVLYIPIDHAVTTAVKNGVSDLFINNAKDFFGTLSMNWRNP